MVPGGGPPLPESEFLDAFNAADGVRLGHELLGEAIDHHDAVDVELALIVGFRFGFSCMHLPSLEILAEAQMA
jgi:hypothetical protein